MDFFRGWQALVLFREKFVARTLLSVATLAINAVRGCLAVTRRIPSKDRHHNVIWEGLVQWVVSPMVLSRSCVAEVQLFYIRHAKNCW